MQKQEIIQLYKQKGFKTQKDFAKAVGIHHVSMNRYMCGRSQPPRQAIIRMAEVLKVKAEKIWKLFFS